MLQDDSERVGPASGAVSLGELRKRLGRSQAEVAGAIGTTQSGVSRIERQPDARLSTLDEYVAALGGVLHLVVEHGGERTEVALPSLRQQRPETQRREYRVIWQDLTTRSLVHVGWLEFTGEEFVFSYTEDARTNARFSPFPPFPQFDQTYRSADLFPFFSVRLVSTADPTFDAIIDALGLTRDEATPAELLARAPSESPHDTIQVIPEPVEAPDGTLVRTFLVSGVRYADEYSGGELGHFLATLEPGTVLELVPEATNPANALALQLAVDNTVVGWVPDHLLPEVHMYLRSERPLTFTVERANGSDAPWHLRILCRMTVAPPS